MTFLPRSKNADLIPASQISSDGGQGPLGIIPAFFAAFEEQSMLFNPLGFEEELRDVENENIQKARSVGADIQPLDETFGDVGLLGTNYAGMAPYTEFQRAAYKADTFQTTADDEEKQRAGMKQRALDLLGSRNDTLKRIQAEHPELGVLTYEQMRDEVVKRGRERFSRWSEGRTGVLGNISGFLGGAIGASDWRTNPMWPVGFLGGGFGKTAAMRILSTAGMGSAAETVQQLTGVRENLQWFGLNPSAGQTLLSIGLAGVLPAALQGGGEFLARRAGVSLDNVRKPTDSRLGRLITQYKGEQRWGGAAGPPPGLFRPPPEPPVPVRTPTATDVALAPRNTTEFLLDRLAPDALSRTRLAVDLDHAARQADMWGTSPADAIPPNTRLSAATSVNPNIKSWLGPGADDINATLPSSWQRAARFDEPAALDLAKQFDPEAVEAWKRVAKQVNDTQAELRRALALAEERTAAGRFGKPETEKLLDELELAATRAKTPAGIKRVNDQIDAVRAMQEGKGDVPTAYQPEAISARLANQVAKKEQIAPLVDRAVARGVQQWEAVDAPRFAKLSAETPLAPVKGFKKKPKVEPINGTPPKGERVFAPREPDIPELRDPAAAGGKVNEPKMDTVVRVQEARAKTSVDGLEAFEGLVRKWQQQIDETAALPVGTPKGEEAQALLPNGLTLDEVAGMKFQLGEGQEPVTLREFLKDVDFDAEALKAVTSCMV